MTPITPDQSATTAELAKAATVLGLCIVSKPGGLFVEPLNDVIDRIAATPAVVAKSEVAGE